MNSSSMVFVFEKRDAILFVLTIFHIRHFRSLKATNTFQKHQKMMGSQILMAASIFIKPPKQAINIPTAIPVQSPVVNTIAILAIRLYGKHIRRKMCHRMILTTATVAYPNMMM